MIEIKKLALPAFYAATAIAAVMAAYALPATPPTNPEVVIVDSSAGSQDDVDGTGEHAVEPSNAQGPHGQAVSTAAHCPVKGSEHGELVRSIAQDKEATVEDAQEACDAAVEAAEAGGDVNNENKPDKGKPEFAGKPDDATSHGQSKKAEDDATTSDESDTSDDSVDSSNSQGGGPPPDKGNPNKP